MIFADRMRSVGKRPLDESGKYPVNENDEEIFYADRRNARATSLWLLRVPIHSIVLKRSVVIASAEQSIARHNGWMDCFVACASLRKRFAFVAGTDSSHMRAKT
jgi:hypothetical protein